MRMSLGEKWATVLALISVKEVQRFCLGPRQALKIESSEALPKETDSFWNQIIGTKSKDGFKNKVTLVILTRSLVAPWKQ